MASLREPTNRDTERLRDVSNREPLRRGPKNDMKRATHERTSGGNTRELSRRVWWSPLHRISPIPSHVPMHCTTLHVLCIHIYIHIYHGAGPTDLPSPPPPRLFVCAGVTSIPYPPKPLEL